MSEQAEYSRLVDFESPLFNFRDVGGLATTHGAEVRRGVLFRSDTLTALGEADRERFARFGVRTVIDLRHPVELERFGRAPAWCCEDWHNVPLNNPVWRAEDYSAEAGWSRSCWRVITRRPSTRRPTSPAPSS
ncbi:tyrosine-protein phosphatase [Catellatospora coxensis]